MKSSVFSTGETCAPGGADQLLLAHVPSLSGKKLLHFPVVQWCEADLGLLHKGKLALGVALARAEGVTLARAEGDLCPRRGGPASVDTRFPPCPETVAFPRDPVV